MYQIFYFCYKSIHIRYPIQYDKYDPVMFRYLRVTVYHREIIYIDIDRYIALNRFISIIKYRYISINWIKIDIYHFLY